MTKAQTRDMDAAYRFVEGITGQADGHVSGSYPWWHGWALREAFIAGAKHGRADARCITAAAECDFKGNHCRRHQDARAPRRTP